MAAGASIAEQLSAGILALTHAESAQLEGLAEAARGARRPEGPEEQRIAQERLRTLGALIVLTRRNLRLLRGGGGYEALRD
jgi:hypothetical protein